MIQLRELPWENIHEFLLACGNINDSRELCVEVVKQIQNLIPYDQARIFFIDYDGRIYDEVLFKVEKRWSKVFREYYSKIESGRYKIKQNRDTSPTVSLVANRDILDWTSQNDEFVTNYIKPQGIHYSLGFGLRDAYGMRRCACAIDRTSDTYYSEKEISIANVILTHANNLHKNLSLLPISKSKTNSILETAKYNELPLTSREAEIANLLCQGLTPASISKNLCMSVSTVYWHIANIHSKLQVSNRQELILKLLR
ncbi:hypothetical protein AGMMS49983_15180 [Clostridia bacterium]|nr:hypothetical protein AGMMS49983_15180 [Clostridia bacterium]